MKLLKRTIVLIMIASIMSVFSCKSGINEPEGRINYNIFTTGALRVPVSVKKLDQFVYNYEPKNANTNLGLEGEPIDKETTVSVWFNAPESGWGPIIDNFIFRVWVDKNKKLSFTISSSTAEDGFHKSLSKEDFESKILNNKKLKDNVKDLLKNNYTLKKDVYLLNDSVSKKDEANIEYRLADYLDYIKLSKVTSQEEIADNTWYNVTAVYNESKYIKLYVNGVISGYLDIKEVAGGVGVKKTNYFLARHIGTDSNPTFSGLIDAEAVRIYNRELSSKEIASWYNATKNKFK